MSAPPESLTSPLKRLPLRNVAVGLLVLAGCINFIDRSAVSIALPAIRVDLHLSESEAGLLLSAFAWSYAVAQLPAGSLVDRLGARAALAGGLAAWSAVQMATSLVTGLPSFILARVALGLGESPMFVGGARVCADRFVPAERAVPLGLLNASASLGPAIAPLVLTPLMVVLGWRSSFAVLGGLGLVVAAAWGAIYRNAGVCLGRGPTHRRACVVAATFRTVDCVGPAAWICRNRLHDVAVCHLVAGLFA
jgi:MFS family permease